ncbi:uncharacterized protein [Nothobranchius furzeri]|uniref:uncharacterized protein n=1 Tax=Nothobranchius furzeri TaxID=105023 RepID=UPI003904AE1E
MTDEQLKSYLPSYGDRLALLGYCRRKENGYPNWRKTKLFERLKSKLHKRRRTADEDGSSTEQEEQSATPVKKNALKSKRKIELGWMIYDEEIEAFKQVRAKRGGGTRRVDVSKDAKKNDIIQMAVDLFFPNGRNREGSLADFEVDLRDYQEVAVDDNITVGQLYFDTKLPVIRFYLTTRKKMETHSNCQDEESSPFAQDHNSSHSHPSSSSAFNDATIIQATESETVTTDLIFFENSTNDENIELTFHSTEFMDEDTSNTVFVGEFSESEPQILDDTLPLSPQTLSLAEPVKKILVVHRGQVLRQLILHFCDDKILESNFRIQLVLPDGKPEMAFDEGGVVRDCLIEFWKDFYEQCTTGNAYKVPFLRHDYGQEQWESVGRIIAFGWTRQKYLPVGIAPVILEQAAFGHVKSDVVENFLKYMPESERTVFQPWQADFSSVDQEELLEILDNHCCRRLPTASNANEIQRWKVTNYIYSRYCN